MLYHDRVTVRLYVYVGVDDRGNDKFEWQIHPNVPATVYPLDADLSMSDNRATVITRYRMVLASTLTIPVMAATDIRIEWGQYVVDPAVTNSGLFVDGGIERHYMRGRLHHYELTTKQVVG
ncbi:hypothetical protein A5637_18645 [Mycolicibacterium fortuitum]|uniref:hypothetical protein n=1 Tax=Mycolicibacterium fortuitum TaxID=1766 RepID=UPI0007EC8932|nr:hypothetical protein [Mycolicibacterium fortuitum]OBK01716.1 hypothetical protein A5637_18645 [Mycolicibacterium fortuitum]